MALRVLITEAAKRDIRRLPREIQQAIFDKVQDLVEEPFPSGYKKIEPRWENHYRVKIRKDYRLIYALGEDGLVLVVVRAGHRSDIYR